MMKNLYAPCLIAGFIFMTMITPLLVTGQNVGIGTNSPDTRLHVFSTSGHLAKFDGGPNMYISLFEESIYRGYLGSFAGADADVDFGTGAGNTNGKLHLTIQATPRLTIGSNGNVGIGNTNPQYKLQVNGAAGIGGALYINGNSGQPGQVLTSNGASAPIWQQAALSNTVRFGVRFQRVGSGSTALSLQTTYYNLSPADITIASDGITIGKSGLYRLNGYVTGLIQGSFAQLPEMTMDLNFSGSFSTQYDLAQWKLMSKRTQVNNNYYEVVPYTLDIYLPAGTVMKFNGSYLADAAITYQEANIRMFAYLISE